MDKRFIKGLAIDWDGIGEDSYLRTIPALQGLSELYLDENITFFVGENGTGKSTLLEAIAVEFGFNAEGGSRNFNFSTKDTHSELCSNLRLYKGSVPKWGFFLRAESFYNTATVLDTYVQENPEKYLERYGGKSLHCQSHGESFLALMQNQFVPKGLYLLDEPEAALSPQRQLSLLYCIFQLAQKGAQFIIATHSPILLGMPEAEILSFDRAGIHTVEYRDTESYQVTKLFMNHRETVLRQLLQPNEEKNNEN